MRVISLITSSSPTLIPHSHPHLNNRGTAALLSSSLSSPTVIIKSQLLPTRSRTTRIPNFRGMSIESGNVQSTVVPTSVPVRVAYELLQAGHRYLDVRGANLGKGH